MAARSNYGVKVCTHRSLRHPRSWCADMLMRSAHFLSILDCLLHRSPVTIPVGSSVMDAQYFCSSSASPPRFLENRQPLAKRRQIRHRKCDGEQPVSPNPLSDGR